MKSAIFSIILSLVITMAALSAIIGAFGLCFHMATDRQYIMKYFQLFSLSSILFLVGITAFVLVKILNNTEAIMDSLIQYFTFKLNNRPGPNVMPPVILSSFSVSDMDKSDAGKMTTEMIMNMFGIKNKKLEDMTIEELRVEEKKAVDNQNFELAANIVAMIESKEKKNN